MSTNRFFGKTEPPIPVPSSALTKADGDVTQRKLFDKLGARVAIGKLKEDGSIEFTERRIFSYEVKTKTGQTKMLKCFLPVDRSLTDDLTPIYEKKYDIPDEALADPISYVVLQASQMPVNKMKEFSSSNDFKKAKIKETAGTKPPQPNEFVIIIGLKNNHRYLAAQENHVMLAGDLVIEKDSSGFRVTSVDNKSGGYNFPRVLDKTVKTVATEPTISEMKPNTLIMYEEPNSQQLTAYWLENGNLKNTAFSADKNITSRLPADGKSKIGPDLFDAIATKYKANPDDVNPMYERAIQSQIVIAENCFHVALKAFGVAEKSQPETNLQPRLA